MTENIPEITPMKPWTRLASLFVSPAALAEDIKAHARPWLPLLVCVVISLLSLPLTLRYTDIQTRQLSYTSLERYGVDYFNLVTADEDDSGLAETISAVTYAASVGSALLAYPIAALFSALGLFVLAKIFRGPGRYPQYFALYAHVNIIAALCAAATAGACVAFDNTLDVLSLAAAFMPDGNNASVVFNTLSAITLPGVWTAAIVIIGLKVLNDWPARTAVLVGLIAFAFSVAVTAGSLGSTFYIMDWLDGYL